MSIDWRFGRDDASAGPAPAADELDDGPPSRARRMAVVLGVVGAVALVVAGAHAWRNARVLDSIADDVRAVVVAEEAARARGDGEVARMHQTAERLRHLSDSSAPEILDGLPPPLPGLEVVGAGTVDGIDVAVGAGGRIQRAEAELVYTVTDGEITGTFRAMRPMELEADGRWRHGMPVTATATTESSRNMMPKVSTYAPIEDRAWLLQAMARADGLRERYCRMAPCHPMSIRINFKEYEAGTVRWMEVSREELPILTLASPSHAMRPTDEGAEMLLERAFTRMVLALSMQRNGSNRFPLRDEMMGSTESFTVGLAEAALAADGSPDEPEALAEWVPSSSMTLERIWPGTQRRPRADAAPQPALPPAQTRRAAQAFGAYIAGAHGRDALERLIRSLDDAVPDPRWEAGGVPTSPYQWLEAALGDEALAAVMNWPEAQSPAPAGIGFIASCLQPEGLGWSPGQPMLVRPGEAPRAIAEALCGARDLLLAPPQGANGFLAAVCGYEAQGGVEAAPKESRVALLEPDGRVRRVSLPGAPSLSIAGPDWSSDGRWVATVMAEVNPDAFVVEPWVVRARVGTTPPAATRLATTSLDHKDWGAASRYSARAWQPDGRLLATVIPGDAGTTVVAHDVEEANAAWTVPGHAPTWSPDGRRLAVISAITTTTLSLAVVDAASGAVQSRRTIDVTRSTESGAMLPVDEDLSVPRLSWSPDGAWVAARVSTRDNGLLALVAWQPVQDTLHVADYEVRGAERGNWTEAWHPREPIVFLVRNDLFADTGTTFPWQFDVSPVQLALDVTTGRSTWLEPGDRALEVLHWPLSPDGRWRVRRDAIGRLEIEPVGGGTAWRLNAPGCSVDVDWLDAARGRRAGSP